MLLVDETFSLDPFDSFLDLELDLELDLDLDLDDDDDNEDEIDGLYSTAATFSITPLPFSLVIVGDEGIETSIGPPYCCLAMIISNDSALSLRSINHGFSFPFKV